MVLEEYVGMALWCSETDTLETHTLAEAERKITYLWEEAVQTEYELDQRSARSRTNLSHQST